MRFGIFGAVVLAVFIAPLGAFAEVENVELTTVGIDFAELVVTTSNETSAIELTFGRSSCDTTAIPNSYKMRYHLIRMDGLESGTDYRYCLKVDGEDVPETTWHPGKFTTLEPNGNLLFSFAMVTDTHVGEEVAGLVEGTDSEGFSWPDPDNPYWKFTNVAAVQEINKGDFAFTIHKGDITSGARAEEFADADAIFGQLDKPLYPLRGNHDRPGDGPDFFLETYQLDRAWRSFEYQGQLFVMVDSVNPQSGWPEISEEQFVWLQSELDRAVAARMPIWIFLHHVASEQADFIFTLWGETQRRFLEIVASASPYVLAVFSGHSHRNTALASEAAPGVDFIETCATKEYPGCWNEIRVYSRGWAKINRQIDCPECREWFAITTGMYNGRAQEIKAGTLQDRCFTRDYPDALLETMIDGDEDPDMESDGPEDEMDTSELADEDETTEIENQDDETGGSCSAPGKVSYLFALLFLLLCFRMRRGAPESFH